MKLELNIDGEVSASPSLKLKLINSWDEMAYFSDEVKQNCLDLVKGGIKHKGFRSSLSDKLFLGKMTRSKLVYCVGKSKNIPIDKMMRVACTVELLHEASLVHDDVQDQQQERRGVSTVWYEYSVSEAISWGDFLLSLSFEPLLQNEQCPRQDMLNFNKTFQRMLEGQNKEQTSVGRLLGHNDYIQIAELKTASLLELVMLLLFDEAGPHRAELLNACRCLGIAYQIQNDLDDFLSGVKGVDYKNKISSLPFLKLYDLRRRENLSYRYEQIFEDEIDASELSAVQDILQPLIDEKTNTTFSIFSKQLSHECFELLMKSFRGALKSNKNE